MRTITALVFAGPMWSSWIFETTAGNVPITALVGHRATFDVVGPQHVWQLFQAISKSWVIEHAVAVPKPMFGLFRDHAQLLDATLLARVKGYITAGNIDPAMELLTTSQTRIAWLPHVHTLDARDVARDQESIPVVAAPATATTLPEEPTPINTMPVTLGRSALGPWVWRNPFHAGCVEACWTSGSGIGVPELFIGLPGNVSLFGIHAEARGGDFVNILSRSSDPGVPALLLHLGRSTNARLQQIL